MSTDRSDVAATTSHRIVVGTDGSEHGKQAVEWAAAQAERCGTSLEIHTAYWPGYEFATRDDILHGMQRTVEEAAGQAKAVAPNVAISTHVHEAQPADALIKASTGADLLVVGTRGLGGFKGLLLGSVSHQCAAHARCAVTIVR